MGKGISGNALKMIAAAAMLTDHAGAVLIEVGILGPALFMDSAEVPDALLPWLLADALLRLVGRIAFPIFCYLLAEGFCHTRNAGKYALRLLVFAVLSEIPFDLALFDTWFYPGYQSVYVTLLLGLLLLMTLKRIGDGGAPWKKIAAVVGFGAAAQLLKCDYGAFGTTLIALFYFTRKNRRMQTICACLALIWEVTAPLAMIPIRMYNGTRGKARLKYGFYAFYPLHLLVLWGLRLWLIG